MGRFHDPSLHRFDTVLQYQHATDRRTDKHADHRYAIPTRCKNTANTPLCMHYNTSLYLGKTFLCKESMTTSLLTKINVVATSLLPYRPIVAALIITRKKRSNYTRIKCDLYCPVIGAVLCMFSYRVTEILKYSFCIWC